MRSMVVNACMSPQAALLQRRSDRLCRRPWNDAPAALAGPLYSLGVKDDDAGRVRRLAPRAIHPRVVMRGIRPERDTPPFPPHFRQPSATSTARPSPAKQQSRPAPDIGQGP